MVDATLNTHHYPQIHRQGPEQEGVSCRKLQCYQLIMNWPSSSVIIIRKGSKRLSTLQPLICILNNAVQRRSRLMRLGSPSALMCEDTKTCSSNTDDERKIIKKTQRRKGKYKSHNNGFAIYRS